MDGVEVWGLVVVVGSSGAEIATRVLGGSGRPDLAVVESLARGQLWARRAGGSLTLREAGEDLVALLDLVGLLREVGGEPEAREEVLGVEEGMEPRDPAP